MGELFRRIRYLINWRRLKAELADEMEFHREMAARAGRNNFGNTLRLREQAYEAWGWVWLEQIGHDVRYALRQLKKTPGFMATAVLTLALGIGANAAIFTLVDAIMMRNLPVADPKTLVRLGDDNDCCVNFATREDGDLTLFSTDTYEQLRKNTPEFEDLAAIQAGFTFRPVTARRDGNGELARSVMGEFVSGNYFRTFGLRPEEGRLLTDADDLAGAPRTAVMSYETWRRDYAGDDSIIGGTFWINTKPVTITGIAPRGYFGDRLTTTPPDFYLPIETMPDLANAPYVHEPGAHWLYLIGRAKPGVALGPLQVKLSALLRQIFASSGEFSSEHGKVLLARVHVVLTSGGAGIQDLRDQYGANLRLLMISSGLVLLIACANIANLLLVRGMARKAEMSVRIALGAARSRIVRQLLTESVVLAGVSGLVGLLVAYAGTRMLLALAFPGAERLPIQASPSIPVLEFAFAVSLVTSVLFGVAPAWIAAQAQPTEALRTGSRTTSTRASMLQRGLVVLQAALSLVLLVSAGLFSQSLNKLQGADMKLDAKNRYILHINPQAAGYAQTQVEALYRTIEQRFHELPGVKNVGISSYTPMEDNNNGWGVQVQGRPDRTTQASFIKASAEYFDSVGTRVLAGRGIGPQDTSGKPPVSVVNEDFVKKLFEPGENPIGHHFGLPGPESNGDYEIVGVVENTAYTTVRWTSHPMYFVPMAQRPLRNTWIPIDKDEMMYAGAIVLQTERPVDNIEALARQTLAGINPNLAVVKFQAFDRQIAERFTEDRMIARLTILFGGLALLLGTVGLYGVTAYTVSRRTSEIGIRMALGARPANVIAMVMRGAMGQTILGLAIGIPAALLCARFAESQLYEIKGGNAEVMLVAIVVLALASLLAGVIPARTAAATEPAQTLRAE